MECIVDGCLQRDEVRGRVAAKGSIHQAPLIVTWPLHQDHLMCGAHQAHLCRHICSADMPGMHMQEVGGGACECSTWPLAALSDMAAKSPSGLMLSTPVTTRAATP